MGTTTFTGPIRAGNILNTSGATLGTDVANVGYVVMAQSSVFTQAATTTSIVIPANSQILSIDVNVTTEFTGVATTFGIGTTASATFFTAAGALDGVFVGCKYLSVSQKRTVWSNYWPGSDVASGNTVTSYYVNDPNAKFIAQTDATGLTQAGVGANIGFNIGTPNPNSGISGAYIDVSTLSPSTTTLPFRVVSLVTDPPGVNGTAAGAYNLAIVAFNSVTTKTLVGI